MAERADATIIATRIRDSASRLALALSQRAQTLFASLRHDRALRERALAGTVFAMIFAGFVGGVDYVITGGPTWNPGGEAPAFVAPPHVRAATTTEPILVGYAPPPPILTAAVDLRDYEMPIEDLLGAPYADFRATAFDPYAAYGESVGGGAKHEETSAF